MAGTRRLSQLLEETRSELRLPDGPLVVALSGGADSGALALILVDGRQVRALHVDHGLTHSPMMRRAAVSIAERLGIDIEVVEVVLGPGASPEGRARSARYEAFSRAIGAGESLLTGHTVEDNLETILINLVRGTGIRGLAGIPAHRPPRIHRPMLGVSRGRTRELAMLAGLEFADDPMNLDPGLTRNYLRTRIIPGLTALNPNLATAVHRMSQALRADADYLDAVTSETPVVLTPGGARAVVGDLAALPRPVADRVLLRMLGHVCGEGAVSWDMVARVRHVVEGGADRAQVLGSIRARREGPFLEVSEGERPQPGPVRLIPGLHRVGSLVFEVSSRDQVCQVAPLSRWQAIFPAGTDLLASPDGMVQADGAEAWVPGERRLPVAWYRPGALGYLSVFAREDSGWTSSP